MKGKINVVLGTTASGKTKYAVELARKLNGVVINFDSMQVYKEIPILSAQPTVEEKQEVEHLLYGCISCSEKFSVASWIDMATPLIKKVLSDGRTPILVGGTGMYIKSLMDGLSITPKISAATKEKVRVMREKMGNEELHKVLEDLDAKAASTLSKNDFQRVMRALEVVIETGCSLKDWQLQSDKISSFARDDFYLIKIERPRHEIYKNIDKRFVQMIENGAVEEVRVLFNEFGNIEYLRAHGLPEIISYIKGDITLNEAISIAQKNTRNYAKRQTTWMNHQVVFDEVNLGC